MLSEWISARAAAFRPSSLADAAGQVSREMLAENLAVWYAFAAMFAIFGIGIAGLVPLFPSFVDHRLLPFAAVLLVVSVVAFMSAPPPLGTKRNHLPIACVYIFPAIGLVIFRPESVIPVGTALFIGPFTAIRLRSRVQIAAHYALASVVLFIPVALGLVNASAQFAVATVVPAAWALGFCVVIILEAAERQGDELKHLVRVDPLTGVGNRRMLADRLEHELVSHAETGGELSVAALDLNGFKALNDLLGHDAGDALLQRVATALESVSRPQDTVVRQGGDEFCLLLPDTSAAQARWVEAAIRSALADLDQGQTPISTGVGIATFPADGTDGDGLLHVADTRLAKDKSRSAQGITGEQRPHVAAPALNAAPQVIGHSQQSAGLLARVSRQELSVNPYTWFATGAMYALYSVILVGLTLWGLPGNAAWLPLLDAVVVLTAIAIFTNQPPALGTKLNHVVIALTYVLASAMMIAVPTAAGGAFGAAAFIGPLAAVRLIERRQIAAHVVAATVILVAIVAFGLADQNTSLAILMVALAVWGLAFSCVAVLEAAEHQGEQLAWLVRRDPLTGVGNRRALSEQLAFEVSRHARSRRPLTVLVFDLNGFKALNDDVGHGAGDQLLRDVAAVISASVSERATVIRQGGDEYCVLLPETNAVGAGPLIRDICSRLAQVEAHGHVITTGVGLAEYPKDAISEEGLLKVADERLIESKTHGPSRATAALRIV